MALYKYSNFVTQNNASDFDAIHSPGRPAPFAGIYKCEGCGHEIGTAETHPLPPQNHHQHTVAQGKIRWRLAVYAQHN